MSSSSTSSATLSPLGYGFIGIIVAVVIIAVLLVFYWITRTKSLDGWSDTLDSVSASARVTVLDMSADHHENISSFELSFKVKENDIPQAYDENPIRSSNIYNLEIDKPPQMKAPVTTVHMNTSNTPLASLSVDQVQQVMTALGLTSYMDQFASAGLNGAQLALTKTVQDLHECGLTLPSPVVRTLLRFIERASKVGVEPRYLR